MRRLLALLPMAVVLAGCGEATSTSVEDFRGDERAVAQVVEDLQAAGEQQDAEEICRDLLVQDVVRRLERGGSSCAAEIDRAIEDVDDYELVVEDVTITGSTARATVVPREGTDGRAVLRFERVGGAWRAAGLPSAG